MAAKKHIKRPSLAERFWAKVVKTEGCWLWAGATSDGYGQIFADGVLRYAHRLAWEFAFGTVPEAMYVLHNCDANYPPDDFTYRRCVRADHLWLGSCADNQADKAAKGRSCRGERNSNAKLTDEKVREILADHTQGVTGRELARRHGVSTVVISQIIWRKAWKHVL